MAEISATGARGDEYLVEYSLGLNHLRSVGATGYLIANLMSDAVACIRGSVLQASARKEATSDGTA